MRRLTHQIEKAKGADALVTSDAIQKEVQAFYEDIKVVDQEESMGSLMFELWDSRSWEEIPVPPSPSRNTKKRTKNSGRHL